MSTPLDARTLFRLLAEERVDYVVIGGFAVIAHGVVRATKDLDICPSPAAENLRRLAALLRRLDARQAGVGDFAEDEMPYDPTRPEDLALGGNFRLSTAAGDIDIMQWVSGIEADHAYATLAKRAIEVELDGIAIMVCSLGDLLTMKRAAGRAQDQQDLADLTAAHGEGS
ncbi:MAG: hypothetical protein MSC31_14475 [Solirubrobacteraceae bacterium MAG38_C4-C5]|nr:hypothetical protein [Candidatus Siliceabacter maunaloa]